MGERPSGLYLYREFRTVADDGGAVATAVRAMMSATPLDPDLRNPWRAPTHLGVSQDGDAITVDVSADALANSDVGSELAALAVQQLVWTAPPRPRPPGR